jgi:hypothetical protein
MSVTTGYEKSGTDIGTYFCDLTNTQTVAGTKTFSTTPVVGTMATSDNTTSAASTAYVKNQAYATKASPTFTGTVTLPTPTTNSTDAATTAFVKTAIDAISYSTLATKASPTFTGTVTVNANIEIFDALNAFIDFKNNSSRDFDGRIILTGNGNLGIQSTTSITLDSTTVYAPTPAAASDSTNIATTAWVRTKIPDTTSFVTTTNYPFSCNEVIVTSWSQNTQQLFDLPSADWGLYLVTLRAYASDTALTSDMNGMLSFFFSMTYDTHSQSNVHTNIIGDGSSFEPYGNGANSNYGKVKINNRSSYTKAKVRIIKWM